MVARAASFFSAFTESPSERERGLRAAARAALQRLYGDRGDVEAIISAAESLTLKARDTRPAPLKALDAARQETPKWFVRPGRPAYCTYVDRFSADLKSCIDRIPYLSELGVGLFHPLPLLKPREGDSDGGFAVANYREVDPRLGTFADLKDFAHALRMHDMSLVLDVVCNHTAKEHVWAKGWLAGDPAYADFYIRLDSQGEMQAWNQHLSDVFPDTAPGSFSWDDTANGWVWTTFYPFQWDLNYANPRVFLAMLEVLFDLANAGVEGFRLDSAAYLWKIKGTICRNLPQAHDILKAFRDYLSLAAPGVFLLAEAIEGLDEVLEYFGDNATQSECDLAYDNTPMTALWGALAEGRAQVMADALHLSARKPAHGTWLNYARCHDDIIWQALNGWVDQDRLWHWSDYYAGKGASFAKGLAFQAPAGLAPSTCGMAASLCGVGHDGLGIERLKLIYSITYALDGVPMLYMGDELALMNDTHFGDDPEKVAELRWLHRPLMDWSIAEGRHDATTPAGAMFGHIKSLNQALSALPNWANSAPATAIATTDDRLLHIERRLPSGLFKCLANMSGETLSLDSDLHGIDQIGGQYFVALAPYQVVWKFER
jgi:amylosucrase